MFYNNDANPYGRASALFRFAFKVKSLYSSLATINSVFLEGGREIEKAYIGGSDAGRSGGGGRSCHSAEPRVL